MKRLLAITGIISLGAFGCSQAVKRPDRVFSVAVPERWAAGEIAAPAGGDWWAYLGDPGLDTAINEALTRNQDLQAAAARIDVAVAEARVAGAPLTPSMDLSLSRSRQRQNFVGLPIPGREGTVLSTTYTNVGLSLGFDWEADVWGRIKSGHIASLANLESREADLAAARLSLTARVSQAWFAAIEANRQLGLARATLESYQTSAERVRARFHRGLRPSLDLRLALTEVSRAEALVEQRKEQYDRALRQLETLMGGYPGADYEVAEDLPRLESGVPGGLPAEIVHRRPDLFAAERQLLAADARIAQSKAELRPRFSLTSSLGTASNQLSDLVDHNLFVWSLLGGVVQPLINRGALKGAVSRDEARAREAAANYESAILQAYGEVESALAAEEVLERREQALEAATKQSLAARDLAEERYRAGLTDITTVLDSQRTALEAESQLLLIRRSRLDNRVNLHLALGGEFSAQPRTAPAQTTSNISGKVGGS